MKRKYWTTTMTFKSGHSVIDDWDDIEDAEWAAEGANRNNEGVPNPVIRVTLEEVIEERHTIYRKDFEEEPEKNA